VLTGGLFALSVGPTSATARTRALAVLSGVLVPIGLVPWAKFLSRYWPGTTGPLDQPWLTTVPPGLVLWPRFLGRYWPGTTGPLDQPWLTIALAVYSALAPWLLGRAVRQLGRSGSAPR